MIGKKVLIADDEKTVRLAGKIFFEGKGFEVVTAVDGNEALEVAKKEKPDFALLDVIMPGMEGFDVCKIIKEDKDMKNIKVLIFSGNIPEIEKGFEYGADDCIVKPLDWEALVQRMEELID